MLSGRIEDAERSLSETESMVASERRRLKTEVEEEKAALTRDRDAAIEDIRVAKEKSNLAQEGVSMGVMGVCESLFLRKTDRL